MRQVNHWKHLSTLNGDCKCSYAYDDGDGDDGVNVSYVSS